MTRDRYLTPDEVRKQHIERLGPALGPVYNALYNECAWLHVKWRQYVQLYGLNPERINLLNHAARLFFRVVQTTLWEDTLMHLARLTDNPGSGSKKNLTVRSLPPLIQDKIFRMEIENRIDEAIKATTVARDWRNRRIAHRDFALQLKTGAKPLTSASRNDVEVALKAVSRITESIAKFYFKSEARMDWVTETVSHDAVSLLYVIRDGIEAEEARLKRIRERKFTPEDLKGPRPV